MDGSLGAALQHPFAHCVGHHQQLADGGAAEVAGMPAGRAARLFAQSFQVIGGERFRTGRPLAQFLQQQG